MTIRTLLLCLCCTLSFTSAFAQDATTKHDLPGVVNVKYDQNNELPKFLQFGSDTNFKLDEAVSFLQKYFKLPANTTFSVLTEETDRLGVTHTRLQQKTDGLAVMGGMYLMHSRNRRVESMSGHIFNFPINESAPVNVSEDEAVAAVLQHLAADTYSWEVPAVEHNGHTHAQGEYPKPELVWVAEHLDYRLPIFRKAYRTDVLSVSPISRTRTYIDAATGMIVAEENRTCSLADEEGIAETAYSGTQTITTDSNAGTYRLRESGRGIITLTNDTGADFTDADNNWTPASGDINEYAIDAHFGTEVYLDYLAEEHGRNSVDNNGLVLTNSVHTEEGYLNAIWTGAGATLGGGDGVNFGHFATPEIVGHEYQHGTTEFSAGLFYIYEYGGINEFMSDAFGHVIDIRARGVENSSWLVGEQLTLDGEGIRNMADPNSHFAPDTYGGENYNFNNFVHSASGLGNHWFYMLSEGSVGVNDLGTAYDVPALGLDVVAQITMRTLVYYLTPTSDYLDVAFFSKQSAVDLHGPCSSEVDAVIEAWRAAGIDISGNEGFVVDFQADNLQCEDPATVSFQNMSSESASILWTFGDGETSTENSPQHTYAAGGIYSVTLEVTDCNGEMGSTTKTSYVNINPAADFCNSFNMPDQGTTTITECSGTIYDTGGATGDYSNSSNSVLIIDPPSDAQVTLEFGLFVTEADYDYMYVYDGAGTDAPLIGQYSGFTLIGQTFVSTGGAITLQFTSDGSVPTEGFDLFYTTDGGDVPTIPGFDISDNTPPLNAPIVFTSTAEGAGIINYNFGDGTTDSGSEVVHYFTSPGTFTVTQSVDNCLGANETTQTVTVQPAGDFVINPESLTVTLNIGESTDETVTITNAEAGELYYAFSPAPASQNFSSNIQFTEAGATTTHDFAGFHPMTQAIELTVTINGDYDVFTESASIFIEGIDYGVIEDNEVEEETDIVKVFNITDINLVREWLEDGAIEVLVQNTSDVEVIEDSQNKHLVTISTEVADFLTIDQPVGYTAANSATSFNFNFDSEGLLGGTYSYDMPLQTGDPDQTDVLFPVTLIVVGQAAIEVTPTLVDFGEGFINATATADLTINNAGTDTLFITNITSDNPIFAATETSLSVAPQSSIVAEVTFLPTTVGSFLGNFIIENNVSTIMVPTQGTAADAPMVALSPASLVVNLLADETTDEPFNLANAGGAQLNWSILPGDLTDQRNIIFWTFGAAADPVVPNISALLNSLEGNYTVEENNSGELAGLEASLEGKDILVVPNIRAGYLQMYVDVAPTVREFLRQGGSVIVLAEYIDGQFLQALNLMPYAGYTPTYGQEMTVNLPDHPTMENIPATFQNPVASTSLNFTDLVNTEILITADNGSHFAAAREYGLGRLMYLGTPYYTFDAEEQQILSNMVNYGAARELPRWLSPEAFSGSVAGGTDADVSVNFDAENLFAATYEYDMGLETNASDDVLAVNMTLIVEAAPIGEFVADDLVSCNGFINFRDISANNPTTWFWEFGDGETSNEQNPTHFYPSSDVYDVSLTVCNEVGCNTVTYENLITVNLNGTFCDSIYLVHTGDQYVSSCTGSIFDHGTDLYNYPDFCDSWLYLQPVGAETITVTFKSFHTEFQDDILTIYDGADASAPVIGEYSNFGPGTDFQIVSTGPNLTFHFNSTETSTYAGFELEYACTGAAPTADFNTEVSGACLNEILFNNTSVNGENYQWTFGDGFSSTEESPIHTYAEPGEYTVILTAFNSVGGVVSSQTVSVTEAPFTIDINAPDVVTMNVPTSFSYTASTPLSNVEWDSGAGSTSTEENPIFTYPMQGMVTITLTGTDANGCEVTTTFDINIGLSDTDNVDILTAFSVYPNPTEGVATVSIVLPDNSDTELTVYNTVGQLLWQEKRNNVSSYNHNLDLTHLVSGQYFVVVAVNGAIMGRESLIVK